MGLEWNPITIFFAVIAGAVGFAALSFVVIDRVRGVWILGGMLFVSCLGVAVEPSGRILMGLFYPLQAYRSELFLIMGAALGLHVLIHLRSSHGHKPSLQASILVIMGFYAALLRFAHEGGQAGLESVVYAGVTLLPMLLITPVLVRDFTDPVRILRMIALVNAAWIGLVLVQIAASPTMVMMGRENRFIGLLGNPQHAGSLIAVFIAVTLYLFMNDPLRRFKLVWLGLLGVDIILLGWTGSRTGLGMTVLAVTGVLYARFGRAILWLPVIALLAVLTFEAFKALGLTIGFERLASTENTRAAAWSNLLQNGLSSPVIGMGVEGAGDSENGYLYGFAAYGFGMVLLILALIAATAYTSLKLWRRRRYLPLEYRALGDFMIGYFALYFGGSFFEGYMMARVAANLTFFMIFAGIASQLIQMTDRALAAEQYEADEDWEYGIDPDLISPDGDLSPV